MALADIELPDGAGSGVGQCDFAPLVSATGARHDASHHARAGAAAPSNSATSTTAIRILTPSVESINENDVSAALLIEATEVVP